MAYEKAILGIIPGLQATALVGHSLKQTKTMFNPRSSNKKRMGAMFSGSIGTIAGIGLMKPTAQMINDL